jgi:ubiquinone/menaquinone biosynthesis C-methylase UbiE
MDISTADNDVRYVPEEYGPGGDFCAIAHESRYEWVAHTLDLSERSVLDFGCGSGYGVARLAGRARRVLGIDISTRSIEYAIVTHARANASFACHDLTRTDLPRLVEGPFDVVVSFDVIEHVEKFYDFLGNIAALLAPNGTALIGCPNRWATFEFNAAWNEHHMQEFTPAQLDWLLRMRFRDVAVFGQDFASPGVRAAYTVGRQGSKPMVAKARELVKRALPKNALEAIRRVRGRAGSAPGKRLELSDVVFSPLSLADRAACQRPFGIVAICRR